MRRNLLCCVCVLVLDVFLISYFGLLWFAFLFLFLPCVVSGGTFNCIVRVSYVNVALVIACGSGSFFCKGVRFVGVVVASNGCCVFCLCVCSSTLRYLFFVLVAPPG